MVFRDDKDALQQRLADLERDLKDAREGLDRREEELRRLRERLGGLEQKKPSRLLPGLAAGAGLFVLLVGVALAFFTTTARSDAEVAERRAREQHVPPEPPPLPPAPPPPAPPLVEAPPAPTAELTWSATVRASRGTFAEVRAGTKCTIDAQVRGGSSLSFGRVAVTCGERVLYDSAAPATGTMTSMTGGSLEESAANDGAYVYRLVYQDTGTRSLSARPQLEIGTAARVARLFHDGVLGGALDLTVERDSQPRTGEPLTTPAAAD